MTFYKIFLRKRKEKFLIIEGIGEEEGGAKVYGDRRGTHTGW